jgi:hypothetical protein
MWKSRNRATATSIPRIVGRVNDYDVRVARARGEHVWHVHDHLMSSSW